MVELKTIKLNNKSFIEVHVSLPKQNIYIIYSTKCILVGNIFLIDAFSGQCNVFIMMHCKSYIELLESHVYKMNDKAKREGYQNTMTGKEVLLYKDIKKD